MGVPISSVAAKMCILKDQVCSIMSIYSIMYATLSAVPLLQSLLSVIDRDSENNVHSNGEQSRC